MMTLTFAVQNAYAQEVEVYNDSNTRTTYYVEDSSITYTNSDIAFKVKVIVCEKTYSPQEQWYFFEEEEKELNMQKALVSIRDRFGKNSIVKGLNMREGATAMERNKQIGGHKA